MAWGTEHFLLLHIMHIAQRASIKKIWHANGGECPHQSAHLSVEKHCIRSIHVQIQTKPRNSTPFPQKKPIRVFSQKNPPRVLPQSMGARCCEPITGVTLPPVCRTTTHLQYLTRGVVIKWADLQRLTRSWSYDTVLRRH